MDKYNATLANSLDTIAPYKIKKLPTKIFSPWFNDTTRMHKLMCRKLERRWRSTGLQIYYQGWKVVF